MTNSGTKDYDDLMIATPKTKYDEVFTPEIQGEVKGFLYAQGLAGCDSTTRGLCNTLMERM
ncbi:hypothetical protein DFR87_01320 [Metallosphaera hakonensis JCM 8857 = DSM 7519]|uniref:Uncharacterized protein n=1 Tax=Metallosphaera hakonensis JCM 8857 = DSM 7519 TaxID=1293036 RepID=A0A2U9IRC5_9CREN|nr:hypothetical protein [Metallosphaera hakonensis]AWR98565.1 hypothetical protein DFR87_01320 [Metallosphaera hakonensis JCM 8857 = DSM 7519]